MSLDTRVENLSDAYKESIRTMKSKKTQVQDLSNSSLNGPVARRSVIRIKIQLEGLDTLLTRILGYGSAAESHIRLERRDPTLDVITKYTEIRDAARTLATWIGTVLPDGISTMEYSTAVGRDIDLTFSTAQMADYRTNSSLFTATVVS